MSDRATVVTLISAVPEAHGIYEPVAPKARTVYCTVRSVGMRETYEAMSHQLSPEWTIELSDPAEYQDEQTVELEGRRYTVIRTYINRHGGVELTIQRERAHVV